MADWAEIADATDETDEASAGGGLVSACGAERQIGTTGDHPTTNG